MLTQQELDALAAMPREQLEKLFGLIRQARAEFGSRGGMSESAVKPMTDVVDDKQMAQIVQEQKVGRSEPGWLPPTKPRGPEEKRSREARHIPLEPPPGLKWVDQQIDVADALDKVELEKRLRRL